MQVIRAGLVVLAALLGACTVQGVPGIGSGSSPHAGGADDAEEAAPTGAATASASSAGMPDGIPGTVCGDEGVRTMKNEYGYQGACWDPPGYRIAARMPGAAIRGRRTVATADAEREVWWFDMPEAALNPTSSCAQLPGAREDATHAYEPYAEGGFTRPVVGDLTGEPLAEVLDWLDALDLPVCLSVKWDTQCEGHDLVCFQSSRPGDPIGEDGGLQLIVGADIVDEGKPTEQRRYPYVIDRRLDEVLADLQARGFTNVAVVEDTVQCERGVVCNAAPMNPGFVGTGEEIRLYVRRGSR